MLNDIPPYYFWSVWPAFSTWERVFLVALGAVIVYVIYSVAVTASSIRRKNTDLEQVFLPIRKRSIRIQRLTGLAFYVFGIVLFLNLQWAYITLGHTSVPGGWVVLQGIEVDFVFAFNAFIGFLVLHLLGWLMASLVDKCYLKVKPSLGVARNS